MMEPENNRKRKILIVDDEEIIVERIVHLLRDHPLFEVHAFTTGQAAREALQKTKFDLIIADWKLPDVDGATLVREAQAKSPEIVMVLMSGYEMSALKADFGESSTHRYLEKPFAIEQVTGIIDSFFPSKPVAPAPVTPLVLKVILGGDANVGKTSLIQRYCTGKFDPMREMTIGVDFHLYELKIESMPLRLIVWDLGGQERFSFARRSFYRGTQAVALIFDAGNRTSFYNLMRWWRETREYLPEVPILLLTNKTDQPRQVSKEEALQIAQAWNTPLFESSCLTGEGINEFFEALAHAAWKYSRRK
jgi:small GTP-binding protein